ncbi:MAG: hypothetical protein WA671_02080, partial [Candidatus Sulfotelmatobacter sp.]
AFELPAGAPNRFVASSPWKRDQSTVRVSLTTGEEHVFTLEPFGVLTLEARPLLVLEKRAKAPTTN